MPFGKNGKMAGAKKKSLPSPMKPVYRATNVKPEPDDVSLGAPRVKKLTAGKRKRLEKAII